MQPYARVGAGQSPPDRAAPSRSEGDRARQVIDIVRQSVVGSGAVSASVPSVTLPARGGQPPVPMVEAGWGGRNRDPGEQRYRGARYRPRHFPKQIPYNFCRKFLHKVLHRPLWRKPCIPFLLGSVFAGGALGGVLDQAARLVGAICLCVPFRLQESCSSMCEAALLDVAVAAVVFQVGKADGDTASCDVDGRAWFGSVGGTGRIPLAAASLVAPIELSHAWGFSIIRWNPQARDFLAEAPAAAPAVAGR